MLEDRCDGISVGLSELVRPAEVHPGSLP